jgi:hypothetical protein
VIGLGRYALGKIWCRRENAAPARYLAYSVGPELLAIGVQELDVQNDEDALTKATPFFHDGLKRIYSTKGGRYF